MGVVFNMSILENIFLVDNKGKRFGLLFGINNKRIEYYREMVSELYLGLEDKFYNKVLFLLGG